MSKILRILKVNLNFLKFKFKKFEQNFLIHPAPIVYYYHFFLFYYLFTS